MKWRGMASTGGDRHFPPEMVFFMKIRKRDRLYQTARWRAKRRAQLGKQGLCELCLRGFGQGIGPTFTVATVCDHIDNSWSTRDEFFRGPFQSLCRECHDEKTKTTDLIRRKRAEALKIQTVEI